jgi:hypothetical protein
MKRRHRRRMSDDDFDGQALVGFIIETAKNVSLYGPVFQKLIGQYAVQFLAKKIGDPNPPRAETLENCANYINQNRGKYPNGVAAMAYGMAKAQNVLEGKIASCGRSMLKDGMNAFLEKTGMASIFGNGTNTTEVFQNQIDALKMMRLLVGEVTLAGDENSSTVSYKGCRYSDSCKVLAQEGVKRDGGSVECTNARSHQAIVEYVTKVPYDFQVMSYNPPNCIFRVFKV